MGIRSRRPVELRPSWTRTGCTWRQLLPAHPQLCTSPVEADWLLYWQLVHMPPSPGRRPCGRAGLNSSGWTRLMLTISKRVELLSPPPPCCLLLPPSLRAPLLLSRRPPEIKPWAFTLSYTPAILQCTFLFLK